MEDPRCAAIEALFDGANLSRPHHLEHPSIEENTDVIGDRARGPSDRPSQLRRSQPDREPLIEKCRIIEIERSERWTSF
jgi:hypothetical protein